MKRSMNNYCIIFVFLFLGLFLHTILPAQVSAVILNPGDIIVSAQQDRIIYKVDPSTGAKEIISAEGYFNSPQFTAMRYDANGNVKDIFVANTSGGNIIHVDPSTGNQTIVSSGIHLSNPRQMAIDCNGDILVADNGPGGAVGIIRINPDTGVQTVVSVGYANPMGLAIEKEGTLIVVDEGVGVYPYQNGKIYRVNPDDGTREVLSEGHFDWYPLVVALDDNGDIILTEVQNYAKGTISRIDKLNGTRTIIYSGWDLSQCFGVAVESNGKILVSDYWKPDYGIYRIDPNGPPNQIPSLLTSGYQYDFHGVEVVKPPSLNCGDGDNEPPVITTCASNKTLDANASCQAAIPDLTVEVEATDNVGVVSITQSPEAGTLVGLGSHAVTLTVSDAAGNSDTCTATVKVEDKTPPTITALSVTPAILWPPNHKMVPVNVVVSTSDNCDFPVCSIISLTSNEPIDGLGDGDTAPDWEITGNLTVNLRSERSGKGSGRFYTIQVQCNDTSGNASTGTVQVSVPRDQGKK